MSNKGSEPRLSGAVLYLAGPLIITTAAYVVNNLVAYVVAMVLMVAIYWPIFVTRKP